MSIYSLNHAYVCYTIRHVIFRRGKCMWMYVCRVLLFYTHTTQSYRENDIVTFHSSFLNMYV